MSYDLTIYGATGFTGTQAARYLVKHAPSGLRLCIAGRNREKLQALAQELRSPALGICVADANDKAAITQMAKDSRVMLSTAGPFSAYGSLVVEACVQAKTHYCDITGETPWARDMIDRHHAKAKEDGTRLVPFSGYDSCPSDLGTLLIVQELRKRGEATRRVFGMHRGKGGFNGGTLASAGYINGRARELADRFLLSPGFQPTEAQSREARDFRGVEKKEGRWAAPFLMAMINTRVVRRSAYLAGDYGPEFSYNEYWSAKSRIEAHVMRLVLGLSATKLGERLAQRFGPKPGEGPSEAAMDGGYFKSRFYGEGARGTRVVSEVSGKGDPGNRVTTIFVCESALALCEPEKLQAGGGVLTPATAMGDVLLERVRARGISARILP